MRNKWILASALCACGCASKTPVPAEVAATSAPPQPIATALPAPLPTVAMSSMPDQNAEPPLANTPEFSLSRDRQNGDPPGTNWGNIVRKNADRQAAEQKTAADEQAVIDSQRMKDRAKANERENEIRELRAQQRMLEKQNEGLSRKNPEFVVGGSEAIQRATDERADLIREKQRQIDAIQNRR